jgi:sugar diacid utilization regulator
MSHAADDSAPAALDLHRHAVREPSVDAVLRRLANHTGAAVLFYDRSGRLTHTVPHPAAPALARLIEPDVARVAAGDADGATIDAPPRAVRLVPIGHVAPRPVLVVTGEPGALAAAAPIVGDAARLLELIWRLEAAERRERRLALADHRVREAVLQLLMGGHVEAARRAAGALRPALTDLVEVHLIAGPPLLRRALAQRCDAISAERAWIVRCPVYSGHLIVIAPAEEKDPAAEKKPAEEEHPAEGRHRFAELVDQDPRCRLGSSQIVALRDVGRGYEQALHALTRSVADAGRTAQYEPVHDLVPLLRPEAPRWAERVLGPLLEYRAARRNEPDADDLLGTLRSWLYFHSGATRQLKVHRNTLAARLRLIETLLHTDLGDVGTQAALHLAVRLQGRRTAPPHGTAPDSDDGLDDGLDALLDTDAVREWAEHEVRPLGDAGSEPARQTLQVWFAHGTRLAPTAATLGISVTATRKRLARVEQILGRTLLNAPPNQHDLWLAMRVAKLLPLDAAVPQTGSAR